MSTDPLPLPSAKNVQNYFCEKKDWRTKSCEKVRCWKKKETEVDAVLKDKRGNWEVYFEYEHNFAECCDELSSLEKVLKWLKKRKAKSPIFCLFYWLPLNPEKECKKSREYLIRYVDFIKNHVSHIFAGTRSLIFLLSGSEYPDKNAVTKVKVLLDRDFDKAEKIIEQEFGPC